MSHGLTQSQCRCAVWPCAQKLLRCAAAWQHVHALFFAQHPGTTATVQTVLQLLGHFRQVKWLKDGAEYAREGTRRLTPNMLHHLKHQGQSCTPHMEHKVKELRK